jgi:transcriptional regulator GlxA family with amidase domain
MDPGLRESIGLTHRRPGHRWTAEELAAAAGLSRSAFFARFKEAVGETPAEYATRWRIHLATRLLRQENHSVAAVGNKVGYGAEAALSNAFLRVVGVRPGAYRKTR